MSDYEISRALSCCRSAARLVRVKLGLPANCKPGSHNKVAAIVVALLLAASGAQAHSWYGGLTEPQRPGVSCCNDSDCAPAQYCPPEGGGIGLFVRGRCFKIDMTTVLPFPSPDGEPHACMAKSDSVPRCVVLGGSS